MTVKDEREDVVKSRRKSFNFCGVICVYIYTVLAVGIGNTTILSHYVCNERKVKDPSVNGSPRRCANLR